MKETERIISLFKKLYDGSPWIDVNLHETLRNITAEQAAKRNIPDCNTIWEITNHLIAWRRNVLRRVQSEVLHSPKNNYFEPVKDQSNEAWQNTLHSLKETQHDWVKFLNGFDSSDFEDVYPPNHMTYYEHIHGILQHDCYHLGQIVMLAKLVK